MSLPPLPHDDRLDDLPEGDADGTLRCPHDGQPLERGAARPRSSATVYRCRTCGYEYRRQVMSKDTVFGVGPARRG